MTSVESWHNPWINCKRLVHTAAVGKLIWQLKTNGRPWPPLSDQTQEFFFHCGTEKYKACPSNCISNISITSPDCEIQNLYWELEIGRYVVLTAQTPVNLVV